MVYRPDDAANRLRFASGHVVGLVRVCAARVNGRRPGDHPLGREPRADADKAGGAHLLPQRPVFEQAQDRLGHRRVARRHLRMAVRLQPESEDYRRALERFEAEAA